MTAGIIKFYQMPSARYSGELGAGYRRIKIQGSGKINSGLFNIITPDSIEPSIRQGLQNQGWNVINFDLSLQTYLNPFGNIPINIYLEADVPDIFSNQQHTDEFTRQLYGYTTFLGSHPVSDVVLKSDGASSGDPRNVVVSDSANWQDLTKNLFSGIGISAPVVIALLIIFLLLKK